MPGRPARRARADKTNVRTELARLRLDSGLSQQTVAEATGIPLATYRRLERGDYRDAPPLPALVNASVLLTGDPVALLTPLLRWHVLHAQAAQPPEPDSLAPNVPPRRPATQPNGPLTARQRGLLRRIHDALTRDDVDGGLSVADDASGQDVRLQFHARDTRGRRRLRVDLVADRSDFAALRDAGLLEASVVRLSPTGASYARQFSS
jgi:DNA-binding XRE family transcriptional regulator